jgi:type VI secretion system secreted protein Hcp
MKKKLLIAIAAAYALATPLAQAASDFFLKIDGIKGESSDAVHRDSIEGFSFSWGCSNTAAVSGGGGAGKATFKEFTVTKKTDSSSAQLLLRCARGNHIPKATLTCRKTGGGDNGYLVIELENVLVSSYSQAADTTDDKPTESISLNFTKISYFYRSDDGTASEAVIDLSTPAN